MAQLIPPPSLDQVKRYMMTDPDAMYSTWEPLYDRLDYPAAGATQFTFFQVPVGQVQGAITKTFADTNLENAGMLSKGVEYVVHGIQVELKLSSADIFSQAFTAGQEDLFVRNYYDVLTSRAVLSFNVLSTPKIRQGPLDQFAPQTWIDINTSFSQTLNATEGGMSYAALKGRAFSTSPMTIESNQSFNVTIDFPVAIPVNTQASIWCRLMGYKYRNMV